MTAGGGLINKHFTGNNCEAKTFNLPLGIGTLGWGGLTCPLAVGGVDLHFQTKLSASLPASLAKSTIGLTAIDADGDDLLCVNLNLDKAGQNDDEENFFKCKGSDDPVITEDTCYTGAAGALGVTETVSLNIHSFASSAGGLDFHGDGIEGFTCSGKTFTKSGQDITFSDSSDCLPSGIVVSAVKYCSDSDQIRVTVKDQVVPLPITATLNKVDCTSFVGSSCRGSDDPVISETTCYRGKAGALGVTETVTISIGSFDSSAGGTLDYVGEGVTGFTCSGKTFTKDGQSITLSDSSDCLPKGVVVSKVLYCSDSDQVKLTIKDTAVPIPISAILSKVDCQSTIEV